MFYKTHPGTRIVSDRKDEAGTKGSAYPGTKRDPKGSQKFLDLHWMYLKWRDGDFGSRKYYRNLLYYHLLDLMGQRIETGYDYVLLSPELIYEQRLRFAFYYGNWLQIDGKVDIGSIREIIGDDSSLLTSWWRSGKLVSVSGVLRDYRIADWENKIYVILKDIRVKIPEKNK